MRRFQRIDINEPSPQETVKILQGLKKNYEEFYNLEYTEKAIEATVDYQNVIFIVQICPIGN